VTKGNSAADNSENKLSMPAANKKIAPSLWELFNLSDKKETSSSRIGSSFTS